MKVEKSFIIRPLPHIKPESCETVGLHLNLTFDGKIKRHQLVRLMRNVVAALEKAAMEGSLSPSDEAPAVQIGIEGPDIETPHGTTGLYFEGPQGTFSAAFEANRMYSGLVIMLNGKDVCAVRQNGAGGVNVEVCDKETSEVTVKTYIPSDPVKEALWRARHGICPVCQKCAEKLGLPEGESIGQNEPFKLVNHPGYTLTEGGFGMCEACGKSGEAYLLHFNDEMKYRQVEVKVTKTSGETFIHKQWLPADYSDKELAEAAVEGTLEDMERAGILVENVALYSILPAEYYQK